LVFPHEIEGLSREEIAANKPYLLKALDSIDASLSQSS